LTCGLKSSIYLGLFPINQKNRFWMGQNGSTYHIGNIGYSNILYVEIQVLMHEI